MLICCQWMKMRQFMHNKRFSHVMCAKNRKNLHRLFVHSKMNERRDFFLEIFAEKWLNLPIEFEFESFQYYLLYQTAKWQSCLQNTIVLYFNRIVVWLWTLNSHEFQALKLLSNSPIFIRSYSSKIVITFRSSIWWWSRNSKFEIELN